MPEREITVSNALGLHARASAKLVRIAEAYDAVICVSRCDDGEKANARDILELLQLAASRGTKLKIRADGKDADIALKAIISLFESGFGEDPISDGLMII